MVVTANLNRRDSILKRGTVITKINGKAKDAIVDTLFNYISTDGYNRTHKYQTLSNRGFFGSLYTSLFGLSEKYTIEYKDSNGQAKTLLFLSIILLLIRQCVPVPGLSEAIPQPSKKERKQQQMNQCPFVEN